MIEELIILTKIIFITIILTADNAVIVGSIAANFVPKNRKSGVQVPISPEMLRKVPKMTPPKSTLFNFWGSLGGSWAPLGGCGVAKFQNIGKDVLQALI